jgi:DNA invertase Pin-like site-specific DNA recombinase
MTDTTRAARAARSRPLAIAYTRVSTAEQAEHGASLDAQATILRDQAARRGWDVEVVREEGKSAKSVKARPLLREVLRRLDDGEADVLLAVRLDRVSRSMADFASMYEQAARKGWSLVMPASDIDTSTSAGPTARFSAQIQAAAAELERGLISARVKEGMAQRKADGYKPTDRNPLGRPAGRPAGRLPLPAAVVTRIKRDRAAGLSLGKIAATLNEEGVPTATGGLARWFPTTVAKVLNSPR